MKMVKTDLFNLIDQTNLVVNEMFEILICLLIYSSSLFSYCIDLLSAWGVLFKLLENFEKTMKIAGKLQENREN